MVLDYDYIDDCINLITGVLVVSTSAKNPIENRTFVLNIAPPSIYNRHYVQNNMTACHISTPVNQWFTYAEF